MTRLRIAALGFVVVCACKSSSAPPIDAARDSAAAPVVAVMPDASAASVVAVTPDASAPPPESVCVPDGCKTLQTIAFDGGSVRVVESARDAGEDECLGAEVVTSEGVTLARTCLQGESTLGATADGGTIDVEYNGLGSPSTWTGTQRVTFSIAPPAILETHGNFFHRLPPCANEDRSWSTALHRGIVDWTVSCSDDVPCKNHRYAIIPRVAASVASSASACATTIDASHGFVKGAPTASFHAVIVGDELVLDAIDDRIFATGEMRDHFEIWTANDEDGYMLHCAGGSEAKAAVTKRIADLDAAPDAATAHARMTLAGMKSLAITYVDTDDGKTTRGSISTSSAARPTKLEDLGAPFDDGSCGRAPKPGPLWEP